MDHSQFTPMDTAFKTIETATSVSNFQLDANLVAQSFDQWTSSPWNVDDCDLMVPACPDSMLSTAVTAWTAVALWTAVGTLLTPICSGVRGCKTWHRFADVVLVKNAAAQSTAPPPLPELLLRIPRGQRRMLRVLAPTVPRGRCEGQSKGRRFRRAGLVACSVLLLDLHEAEARPPRHARRRKRARSSLLLRSVLLRVPACGLLL